jgi:hypothetical protein
MGVRLTKKFSSFVFALITVMLIYSYPVRATEKGIVKSGQYMLMTREQFRNWLFKQNFKRKITIIQQHHTWSPSYRNFNGHNHFSLLEGMEEYHIKERGFSNIAQNITTFPDGKIAVCRPFDHPPEGTIGAKANSIGLCIEHIGNFDKGHDVMTWNQKETIVYINALLCIKFGLTPSIDSITYHHWWNMKTGERVLDNGPAPYVKSCPGTGFFGGNTTKSAKRYFYPLVVRKIKELQRLYFYKGADDLHTVSFTPKHYLSISGSASQCVSYWDTIPVPASCTLTSG